MKQEEVYRNFKGAETAFACPVCGESFLLSPEGSFACGKGHCYDLSAKGYVNLIPGKGPKSLHYPKSLFESRGKVFAAGYYEPLLSAIRETLEELAREKRPLRVLDAGCGEGYYAAALADVPGAELYGADISKEAVQAACKRSRLVKWMVADLARLPLQTGGVDLVLNILSVANYSEFVRILSNGRTILKVVPGADYLKEIREIFADRLQNNRYSNREVVALFENHMGETKKRTLRYTRPVAAEMAAHFIEMTPMTFRSKDKVNRNDSVTKITIDVEILTGTVVAKGRKT